MIAISFTLRFILLLFIVRLLTATTSPVTMMDGLEHLLKPLRKLGLAVHELVMIMTIPKVYPLFIEEAQRIRMLSSAGEQIFGWKSVSSYSVNFRLATTTLTSFNATA